MKMMINKLISLVKFRDVFNKIPFLILLFPILLISYIIIFQGSLSYHEDIIINSNIENVIELHENTSLMKNYMDGFISYDVIKGKSRNTGSIAEITTIVVRFFLLFPYVFQIFLVTYQVKLHKIEHNEFSFLLVLIPQL